MDRLTPQPAHQRTHRRRQKLSCPCALGHKACLKSYLISYKRVLALMREMVAARGGGRYQKIIIASSKTNLLILDDWRMEKLSREQSLDMLEVLEDRYGRGAAIVIAQMPVDQ
ncbi:hypothetical protein DFAR_500002 [Desulfarculales bacterium]